MISYGTYVTLLHNNNSKDIIKLEKGKKVKLFKDTLNHDDIVKMGINKYLRTNNGNLTFATKTTLEEFVTHTLKIPLPILSKDAQLIINILDIKKDLSLKSEFLEVGTGSGAFTLFLSSALFTFGNLHTYDINDKYTQIASNTYKDWIISSKLSDNVKFYNEDVIKNTHPDLFFDGIVIDAPHCDVILEKIYKKTRYGSPIIIFSPNISMIIDIIEMINEDDLPLKKIQILTTDHQFWDIRIKEDITIAKPYPSTHQFGHTGFILHLIHYEVPIKSETQIETKDALNKISCMEDFEEMIIAQSSL